MMPEGWTIKKFAEIADYKTGRTPSRASPDYWSRTSDGIPWVSIADMSKFATLRETKERISQVAFEEVFRGQAICAGTLIMSFKLTIGRVSTLGIDACHNEAIISIFPRHGIDQRYLGYFLAQVDFDGLQDRQVKGNTLNQEKIDRIEVLIPPHNEQSLIADVLDLLRGAIRLQDRSIASAEHLKRAAVRSLLTCGLRREAQKETEIGLMPENWSVAPLGSLGRVGNGSTPKKSIDRYWSGGTHPWLTSSKVYDREITSANHFVTGEALKECHLPQLAPGAILIAITGEGKTLGHCAVLAMHATINQHIAYVAIAATRTDPSFVRGYLETKYAYLRQVGAGGGSTKGALTCAFLRELPVPLPPFDEQQEIAAVLDAIDAKIDLHRRKRAVVEELFNLLLHQLMTGEVRVADLDVSALESKSSAEEAA